MRSLPDGYRAIVIGASGGIGAAFVAALRDDARCGGVDALHRGSSPAVDFDREESLAEAAAALAPRGPFHLVVEAAGVLHADAMRPEKRLAEIRAAAMEHAFRVNAIGPALVLRHFAPLVAKDRGLVALLSAKVGSIGDNRLGGWIGYRASKAALNMIVKTAAIELARTQPNTVVVALHPGTVDTPLSRPFRGETLGRPPREAVAAMLAVLDSLAPADSGAFVDHRGERLPW